jgi:hypothetical protein
MELTNEMLIPTFRASGLTQKEFCKVHNISLEKLRYHLYRKKKVQIKNGKLLSSKTGPAFITFEKPQNDVHMDVNYGSDLLKVKQHLAYSRGTPLWYSHFSSTSNPRAM